LRRYHGVGNRRYPFDRIQQIGTYAAAVATFAESFQTTMVEASDHPGTNVK